MANTWKTEVEDLTEAQPAWSDELVPHCSDDSCQQYDGKRCRIIGCRPGSICEPAVDRMAELLCHRTP
jgi:hypothetical protein